MTQPVTVQEASVEQQRYAAGLSVRDSDDASKAIAERILTSQTEEDIFGGPQSLGNIEESELLFEAILLYNVTFNESSFKSKDPNAPTVYCILEIAKAKPKKAGNVGPNSEWVKDGERFLIGCGARNVMAAAIRGMDVGLYDPDNPIPVQVLVTRKQTGRGFYPYSLRSLRKFGYVTRAEWYAQEKKEADDAEAKLRSQETLF